MNNKNNDNINKNYKIFKWIVDHKKLAIVLSIITCGYYLLIYLFCRYCIKHFDKIINVKKPIRQEHASTSSPSQNATVSVHLTNKNKYIYTNSFKVSGTTYTNEDGKDRQKIIKNIVKKGLSYDYLTPYDGLSNKEIKEEFEAIGQVHDQELDECQFKISKYEGQDAIEVYINNFNEEKFEKIGYVPKKIIKEIMPYLNEKYDLYIKPRIVGGKFKEWDDDDEKMNTYELSYGVEIDFSVKEKNI